MIHSKPAKPPEINDDQERYCRLQMLRGKIEKLLQKIFHGHFPKNPAALYAEMLKLKSVIVPLRKRKIIKDDQYNILLPSSGQVFSDQFDTTLLLLLLKKFCAATYELNKADFEKAAQGRNRIQHMQPSATQQEFDDIVNLLEKPLLALGMPQHDLDEIKTRIIPSNTKFNYNCEPPVANFFGRDQEIQDLHQALINQRQDNSKLGVVVTAIGGCGKTQLVKEYWQIYKDIWYEGIVCKVDCKSKDTIETSFREIGDRRRIDGIKDQKGAYKPVSDIASLVYNHFAMPKELNKERRVLFILDNLNDQALMQGILPLTSPTKPYLIITSQNQEWDQRFDISKLAVFSKDIALEFLRRNVDPNQMANQKKCEELLHKIDYLPLAIQHSTGYIQSTGVNIEMYLSLLTKHPKRMLSYADTENVSTYSTMALAVKRLEDIGDQPTLNLLKLIAYLDRTKIHKGMVI